MQLNQHGFHLRENILVYLKKLFQNLIQQNIVLLFLMFCSLILPLKALDIKYGDEVIVPNVTFSATINSIVNIGAIPVLADINKTNWTIDAEKIEKKSRKNKSNYSCTFIW